MNHLLTLYKQPLVASLVAWMVLALMWVLQQEYTTPKVNLL
jgi:hypothetical protein